MTPTAFQQLQAAGFTLSLADDGQRILVRPKARLTDETRQFIQAHRPELLAYLKQQAANPDELTRMVQHHAQALHAGLTEAEADRATDALMQAARTGVLSMSCCFTCTHLRASNPSRWRCTSTNPMNELSGYPLAREFVMHLHHCPTHQPTPDKA
jgi:hypothetical protein